MKQVLWGHFLTSYYELVLYFKVCFSLIYIPKGFIIYNNMKELHNNWLPSTLEDWRMQSKAS